MINEAAVEAYRQAIRDLRAERASAAGEAAESRETALAELAASAEFHAHAAMRRIGDYFHATPRIEVDISPAQRRALFDRLLAQWRELGDSQPFWSVLTHDEYRVENLDEAAIARFYATGADHAGLIELFCERSRVEIRRGTCVELGCGVGRVTQHLASRFETVIAIDIAAGNLRKCQTMLDRARLGNVECRQLTSPEQLAQLEPFDFFYSTIALQHNQPPIQKYILDVLLSKLRPGGGFLFQTQTYWPGYEFSVDEYLVSPVKTMDMHSLPMPEILRLVETHGHRIREVMEDTWTGRFGSHTFFGLAGPRRRGLLASIFK